jgi:hypothetical protein
MSLKYLARQAFSHPPHVAVAKSLAYGGGIIKASIRQLVERQRLSFEPRGKGHLQSFLGELKVSSSAIPISKTMEHQFDLLGSGWTKVAGSPDISQISPGNRIRSAAIRAMIDFDYSPIDWQLDFKSGYRWREDCLSGTLRYGHEPSVDVKVPWELARMQHLPWLGMSGDDAPAREFRNQVLDFAAANPPGYGVNWLCTMDVAIRAANILMTYDLFVSGGRKLDEAFHSELLALIMAHGKHIMDNLEWHDVHRGNHYLADIVGLLFVAAYLPKTEQSDTWLTFAIRQLVKEVERQFTPDGANFEASTSYHRLSSEMVIYGTALILGLDDAPKLPNWYFERLEHMAEFTMHVTKSNGRIAQIGDNDSGRFFKICPLADLDHRATVGAINGLFVRRDLAEFAGMETTFEASVISTLAKGQKIASYLKSGDSLRAEGQSIKEDIMDNLAVIGDTIIELPVSEVLDGLVTFAYPDFGIYIWRSQRFFLSIRCGPVGQNGNGGHAHNDQLAIELNIDGEDWIADPGTYLYTPSPKERNSYRSVHAHAAPRLGAQEPARLDLGMFRLEDKARGRCLSFDPDGFAGMHKGYGTPLQRCIEFQAGSIRILDMGPVTEQSEAKPITIKDAKSLRELWKLDLSFSPGYGRKY